MVDMIKDVFEQASSEYLSRLPERERRMVEAVDTPEKFLKRVELVKERYLRERSVRCYIFLQPVLDWLRGFDPHIQGFLHASPKALVLLWGSFSFVLEVSVFCKSSPCDFFLTQRMM